MDIVSFVKPLDLLTFDEAGQPRCVWLELVLDRNTGCMVDYRFHTTSVHDRPTGRLH
jgi:hypothetical protein